jgi:UDP-glucose 4-epimerase
MTSNVCWVIGRGGLLGRHVEAELVERGATIWTPEPIDWFDVNKATDRLLREADGFFDLVADSGTSWRVLWCAGAGVVATSPEALAQETRLIKQFLTAIADRLFDDSRLGHRGCLFFASSAGGLYAASPDPPPFDEMSQVAPMAPYGHEKLVQEQLFTELAEQAESDLLVGRLSNLYGPGQKLTKPQGLIAHVGRAALRREPVSIYVPLDTVRDYLLAADAARMTVDTIEHLERRRASGERNGVTTKIFASEVVTTVATVIGLWRQALRRPLRVALAASPSASLQPRVLSFRSRTWPDVLRQPTLLRLGIDAVRRDQLARLMASGAAEVPSSRS